MNTVRTKDGVEIFYKDWGSGQPVVFSHGWPLSADDWDPQMMFFLNKGFRVIAHDRRGHGKPSNTSFDRPPGFAGVLTMIGGTAEIRTALAARLSPWRAR